MTVLSRAGAIWRCRFPGKAPEASFWLRTGIQSCRPRNQVESEGRCSLAGRGRARADCREGGSIPGQPPYSCPAACLPEPHHPTARHYELGLCGRHTRRRLYQRQVHRTASRIFLPSIHWAVCHSFPCSTYRQTKRCKHGTCRWRRYVRGMRRRAPAARPGLHRTHSSMRAAVGSEAAVVTLPRDHTQDRGSRFLFFFKRHIGVQITFFYTAVALTR